MHKSLIAFSVFLLAGCIQGTPDVDEEFQGSCPSWVKLPFNGQIIEGNLQWTNQSVNPNDLQRWDFMAPAYNQTSKLWKAGTGIGDGNLLTYQKHPLDQVVFDFHFRQKAAQQPQRLLYVQDGELHARFFASNNGFVGDSVSVYDEALGPSSAKHDWVFRSNAATGWALYNVTLRISLAADSEEPAPHGIFVQWELLPDLDRNINTASVGAMHYSPEFWYRTCSRDGTRT